MMKAYKIVSEQSDVLSELFAKADATLAIVEEKTMTTISEYITAHWADLSVSAQEHIRRARPELLQSWNLYEEGYRYATVGKKEGIATAADALQEAKDNVDRANYPDIDGTIYVDVYIRNAVTGEIEGEDTVTIEADRTATR